MINRIRKRISARLDRRHMRQGHPVRLILGAGRDRTRGWISTDQDSLDLLKKDDWERFLEGRKATAMLAEHVWEHLDSSDGLTAARHCQEYLEPGGYLRIAVPDAWHPDQAYRDLCKPGGTGAGADDHKVFHSVESLSELLREAGLVPRPLEYFDATGVFHLERYDVSKGRIKRSAMFDHRNQDITLSYTSLIVDGLKPS